MTVFYRQYRPQKLAELVGQEAIAKTLLSQLTSGKIGHGYLFYGPKGTGKTSTARILAKSVNCQVYDSRSSKKKTSIQFGEPCNKCNSCLSITDGSHLDLVEIDAASNRNIDDIRNLREKIKLSPASARFKVYIIDEVHMLTKEAFNALLKTLEEPPAHAIFILCTTEIAKLPPTIISRVQKFNFSRAKVSDLAKVVEKIAKEESIKIEKGAVTSIAEAADGSYRDAISTFNQLSSERKTVTEEDVRKIAKVSGWNQLYRFAGNLANNKLKESVLFIEEISEEGADVSYFAKQVVLFLEKLLFIKIGITKDISADFSSDQQEKMQELAKRYKTSDLQNLMKLFLVAESELKLYPLPQIPVILAVCKFIPQEEDVKDNEGIKDIEDSKGSKGIKDNGDNEDIKAEEVEEKASNSKGSIKQIEENWDKFINRIKPINAHVVALLRSTRPKDFDGQNLTMEVFYRFHKEKLEEPKIINMLDEIMQDIIAKQVRLKFVLSQRQAKPPVAVKKSDVIDIKEDELEKLAQEIFTK